MISSFLTDISASIIVFYPKKIFLTQIDLWKVFFLLLLINELCWNLLLCLQYLVFANIQGPCYLSAKRLLK